MLFTSITPLLATRSALPGLGPYHTFPKIISKKRSTKTAAGATVRGQLSTLPGSHYTFFFQIKKTPKRVSRQRVAAQRVSVGPAMDLELLGEKRIPKRMAELNGLTGP